MSLLTWLKEMSEPIKKPSTEFDFTMRDPRGRIIDPETLLAVQPDGFRPYYTTKQLNGVILTLKKRYTLVHYEQDIENGDKEPKPYQLMILEVLHDELPVLVLIEDQHQILAIQVAQLRMNGMFTFFYDVRSGSFACQRW